MTDAFLDLAEHNVGILRLLPRTHHDLLEDARLAVDNDPAILQARSAQRQAMNRLWRAIMLAPTIDVCEALLNGEHVPLSQLNPEWVARFGLRNQEAA